MSDLLILLDGLTDLRVGLLTGEVAIGSLLKPPSCTLPGLSFTPDTASDCLSMAVRLGVDCLISLSLIGVLATELASDKLPGFNWRGVVDSALGEVLTPFTELDVLPDLREP